jgi:hypothetical protein
MYNETQFQKDETQSGHLGCSHPCDIDLEHHEIQEK